MPQPPRYLLRAKDFVDARYAEAITVEDFAAWSSPRRRIKCHTALIPVFATHPATACG
ncbi:MAG: hypothetical protein QOK09_248 [Mycobacterium sp.]|jgi:hypothetical protein|nr:hypothetical protein [Mycobacterium sp.]